MTDPLDAKGSDFPSTADLCLGLQLLVPVPHSQPLLLA